MRNPRQKDDEKIILLLAGACATLILCFVWIQEWSAPAAIPAPPPPGVPTADFIRNGTNATASSSIPDAALKAAIDMTTANPGGRIPPEQREQLVRLSGVK